MKLLRYGFEGGVFGARETGGFVWHDEAMHEIEHLQKLLADAQYTIGRLMRNEEKTPRVVELEKGIAAIIDKYSLKSLCPCDQRAAINNG